MEQLEFCCVQDCYEDTESLQYAHLYLPGATWAEKHGVMTNTERRINLVKPIVPPPGDAKPDLWIFNRLAERFNKDGKIRFPESAKDIFDEMAKISHGRLSDISGMDHDLIEKNRGIQWPYTREQRERGEPPKKGGVRLYDGKARLIPLPWEDNNEHPDEEYPFWLNTVADPLHRDQSGRGPGPWDQAWRIRPSRLAAGRRHRHGHADGAGALRHGVPAVPLP